MRVWVRNGHAPHLKNRFLTSIALALCPAREHASGARRSKIFPHSHLDARTVSENVLVTCAWRASCFSSAPSVAIMRSASSVSASVSYRDFPSIAPAANPRRRPEGPRGGRRVDGIRRAIGDGSARRRGSLRRRRLGIEKTLDSRPRRLRRANVHLQILERFPPRVGIVRSERLGHRLRLSNRVHVLPEKFCVVHLLQANLLRGGRVRRRRRSRAGTGRVRGKSAVQPAVRGRRRTAGSGSVEPRESGARARRRRLPRALLRLPPRGDGVVFPFGPTPAPNARPAARPCRMSVAIPGNARAPPTPPTIAAPRPSALLPICDVAIRRFSSSVYAREGPSIARRDAA